MRFVDYGAAAALFVLGCVHNLVAAPQAFDALDARALWFVTGGIVLWYAAIINFLGLRGKSQTPATRALVAFANAVLVAFALAFAAVRNSSGDVQNAALFAPAGWLFFRSLTNRRGSSGR